MSGASTTPATGGQGTETTPVWLGSIPEDMTVETKGEDGAAVTVPLSQHPKMLEFKDAGSLGKAYLELQKAVGKKAQGLVKPSDDAPDEDKAAFDKELRGMLGIPDGPEGYELKVAEGTADDDPFVALYKGWAHEAGVPPAAIQDLYDRFRAESVRHWEAQGKAEQARTVAEVEALAKAGGVTPEAYTEQGKRGFDAIAEKLSVDKARRGQFLEAYGDDPVVLEVFNGLGKLFKEDTLEGDGGQQPKVKKQTPEEYYGKMFNGS